MDSMSGEERLCARVYVYVKHGARGVCVCVWGGDTCVVREREGGEKLWGRIWLGVRSPFRGLPLYIQTERGEEPPVKKKDENPDDNPDRGMLKKAKLTQMIRRLIENDDVRSLIRQGRESDPTLLPPAQHHHGLDGIHSPDLKFPEERSHLLISRALELFHHVLHGGKAEIELIGRVLSEVTET